MKRLITLIKKNFKLIIRSKSSALIIVLGPLLLISLIGAAFNTASIYGIRIGVYSESYSPLSEAIIHELNENKYISQKTSSPLACTDGVKNSVFHVCAIFPKDLKATEGGNIEFYVDNSKVNIVYLISETISSQIGEKTKQLSTQLTKTVVDTLDQVESEIKDKEQLIKAVKTNNEETAGTLELVSDDLINLQLTYNINNFPLNTLESNLGNSTQAISAFDKLESDLKTLLTEINKADAIRLKSVEILNKLSLDADSNKVSIAKIENTFGIIKQDINSIKETGVGKIVNPINAEIKPITTQKTHLNFIFPTLLIMVIMFVSILLSSTLEIREKTSKVYFKNFITPTSETSFILGNYITNLIIVLFQTGILLSFAYFFFKENITSSLVLAIPALFLTTSLFIFLGISLGNIFKSEETNTIAVISLGFILLFFSSAILPIETLPAVIKSIAQFNPFYIAETLLNKILLFQASLKNTSEQFILLSTYFISSIFIAFIVKKFTRRQ